MMYGLKGSLPSKEMGNDSTLRAYTTCFDDVSMPDERSIDFKSSNFGAKMHDQ